MYVSKQCFTSFNQSINSIDLPTKFTFPFYYEPHPLCLLATEQLQQHLTTQKQWQHDFGLVNVNDNSIGKMFGVLIVQDSNGNVGYLSAFSGKLANQNILPHFVPPVFDILSKECFFTNEQTHINNINAQILNKENNPEIEKLKNLLEILSIEAKHQISTLQDEIIIQRKKRKLLRDTFEKSVVSQNKAQENALLKEQLAKESIAEKNKLKALKLHFTNQTNGFSAPLKRLTDEVNELKNQRKILSAALQQKIFEQYRFLNSHGEEKSLQEIFISSKTQQPPAGAGECAAPKLLHYAFLSNMKPLAMAEFWWGASPKSEVRQHKNFYPSCLGKCKPILQHMLDSIEMDDNPLLINPAIGKKLGIIYQDEFIVVINKPAEFLSVPGKNITDSVYERMKAAFPSAEGPLIVHRLDMSTSGLMVIALTKDANKYLQRQFINRSVTKRYVALLDGILTEPQGAINLPLRGDLDDRPRQRVCYKYGKAAQTYWQVIEQQGTQTKVALTPKTGRTHQLRVHCAHILGLNTPIVGDDLYGKKSNRLHLHAQLLAFKHPGTHELMQFKAEAEF